MKITWMGHACFKIEKDGYNLVIDPYTKGSVPGYQPLDIEANMVLCTHEHGDHSGVEEVRLVETAKNPFQIETIDSYHDDVQGTKRGPNKIYVIDDGACRVAHLGDIGCELTEEQIQRLTDLDAVMVPVGGYYTIDGRQAAELMHIIKPRIIIPMHFRDDQAGFGYDEIDTVDTFERYMKDASKTEKSEIDVSDEHLSGVIVLKPFCI